MKTKLLKKLRRIVKSEKRIWIWMSPIDRRNKILEEVSKIRKRKNIKPKTSAQQKQHFIDMMRWGKEIGLYDDNPKNHGYER
jgi:hypothetical protein